MRQHFALDVDDFAAVDRAAKAHGVLKFETFSNCMYELPDSAVQMYLRDPAGPVIEDELTERCDPRPERLPELKKLNDRVRQTGEALEATLYLVGRPKLPAG